MLNDFANINGHDINLPLLVLPLLYGSDLLLLLLGLLQPEIESIKIVLLLLLLWLNIKISLDIYGDYENVNELEVPALQQNGVRYRFQGGFLGAAHQE